MLTQKANSAFLQNMTATLCLFALVVFAAVGSTQAVTITNAGFEANSFTTAPGYISSNGSVPITGWTSTNDTRIGLNPASGSPFADNGTIPQGTQVSFIQNSGGTGTLSQTVTGLVPGQKYRLSYRYNARSSGEPRIDAKVDGATLQDTIIKRVGGANQYYQGARTFVAAGTTATVTFANTKGAADTTVVIDDVKVESANAPGWTVGSWTNDADSGIGGPPQAYTHALNWNGANVTVNGIAFTGTSGGNPSGANYSWSGLPNSFPNDANTITGASATLANDFNYGNDNVTETLTISGLIPGADYVAMFFGVGFDNQPGDRFSHWTVDGTTVTFNENENGNNNGIRLSYRYTAPGSGTMTFSMLDLVNATWHQYAFTNALVVPEPSTFAMGTLGLLSLGFVGW